MCEAQRACKRGKLGCLWCTNLYVKTAVQLWGKKEREAPQKKGRPALGEKRLAYSAASPRSGANCGVAASQSQKSAMIKTTAQRASGVKILRAKSRRKNGSAKVWEKSGAKHRKLWQNYQLSGCTKNKVVLPFKKHVISPLGIVVN